MSVEILFENITNKTALNEFYVNGIGTDTAASTMLSLKFCLSLKLLFFVTEIMTKCFESQNLCS